MDVIGLCSIRGHRWQIVETEKPTVDGARVAGYCDYDNRVLCIDRECVGLERAQTLIHETLHACSPDVSESFVQGTEEAIVNVLTATGYDLDTDDE